MTRWKMQDNEIQTLNTELQTEQSEQESLFSCLPAEVVEKLTPAKMRMLTMYLTGLYTQGHIAKIIGVSANTVRVWLMSDEVQSALNIIQQKEFNVIDARLKSMRHKALDTMDDLLDSPIDQVRYNASKDILDRTGHKAMQSIKVDKTVTNIEQQLRNLSAFNVDEDNIVDVDVDDIVELIKNG